MNKALLTAVALAAVLGGTGCKPKGDTPAESTMNTSAPQYGAVNSAPANTAATNAAPANTAAGANNAAGATSAAGDAKSPGADANAANEAARNPVPAGK